jgi:hypothetical protein
MPLIDTTTLLGIADRAAYQYMTIDEAWAELNQVGGGLYFDRVTVTNDKDIELPTEPGYSLVDRRLPDVMRAVRNGTDLCQIISGMDNHFIVVGQPGGWDGYLYTQGERVSQWFNDLFFTCKNQYMLAINVFSEGDDIFATIEIAAGPTTIFTDGINYGTGDDTNPADGSNYAGTQLKAKVVVMGASNLDLRLSVKDLNDNPAIIDFTVPASSPVGTEISIGTTSDRFLDVIGVSLIPASSYGSLGDKVEIMNLKERQIAL